MMIMMIVDDDYKHMAYIYIYIYIYIHNLCLFVHIDGDDRIR